MTMYRSCFMLVLAIMFTGCDNSSETPGTHKDASCHDRASSTSMNRPTNNMEVFLLVGQSNMVGMDTRGMGGSVSRNASHVWSYTADGIKAAEDPLHGNGVGPGLSFGASFYEYTGKDVVLVPCAHVGSSITEWQPGEYLYDNCLSLAESASQYGTVSGVLFYQGERDAKSFSEADAWPGLFRSFVDSLREDLCDNTIPVVFAQIGPFEPRYSDDHPAWQYMQAIQSAVSMNGVSMVKTSDLSLVDYIHLDADSQRVLGPRFADALLFGMGGSAHIDHQ